MSNDARRIQREIEADREIRATYQKKADALLPTIAKARSHLQNMLVGRPDTQQVRDLLTDLEAQHAALLRTVAACDADIAKLEGQLVALRIVESA